MCQRNELKAVRDICYNSVALFKSFCEKAVCDFCCKRIALDIAHLRAAADNIGLVGMFANSFEEQLLTGNIGDRKIINNTGVFDLVPLFSVPNQSFLKALVLQLIHFSYPLSILTFYFSLPASALRRRSLSGSPGRRKRGRRTLEPLFWLRRFICLRPACKQILPHPEFLLPLPHRRCSQRF